MAYVWKLRFRLKNDYIVTAKSEVFLIDETLDGAINQLAGLKRDRGELVEVLQQQYVTVKAGL